jgi:hypothetical protein
MAEISKKRDHAGGILEDGSWKRNHQEKSPRGDMEGASWRRGDDGQAIMDQLSRRHNHRGAIMEERSQSLVWSWCSPAQATASIDFERNTLRK